MTLTDGSCRFEAAAETLDAGRMAITFVNRSSVVGAFHLWKLDEGHDFEEFVTFVKTHREAFEQGLPDTGPPSFATFVGREVRTDSTDSLTLDAGAAAYGVACIVPNEKAGRLVATYAAGPIIVGVP